MAPVKSAPVKQKTDREEKKWDVRVERAIKANMEWIRSYNFKIGHPDEIRATKISLGRQINTDFQDNFLFYFQFPATDLSEL